MSDLNMERVSALWCNSIEEAREELESSILRMTALDGALAAMKKEPFVVGDGFAELPSKEFWKQILLNGEIHLAKDEVGYLAMHLITHIQVGMWAIWEAFTPPKRRTNPRVLKSAELVLEYCFAPHGLNLKKVKALVHPQNVGAESYLKHLGFVKRASLPNEALFNNESHTMILWELDNPLLKVNQLAPERDKEVDDDWDSVSDGNSGVANARLSGDAGVQSGGDSSADGYEPVPDPWDALIGITDSQRSMAGTTNRQPANAGGGAGRNAAPRATANYWES